MITPEQIEATARWFQAAYEKTRSCPKSWDQEPPEAKRGYLLVAKMHLKALAKLQ